MMNRTGHMAVESMVNIIEASISEPPFFADPANPTEDEMAAIGRTVFNWCPKVSVQNITNSTCDCDLCLLLRLNTCGPRLIQFMGYIHCLTDVNTDTDPCSDCEICEHTRQNLHCFVNVNCECEYCEMYNDIYSI